MLSHLGPSSQLTLHRDPFPSSLFVIVCHSFISVSLLSLEILSCFLSFSVFWFLLCLYDFFFAILIAHYAI